MRRLLPLLALAGCSSRFDGTYRVLYEFKDAACSDLESPVPPGFDLSAFTTLQVYQTDNDKLIIYLAPAGEIKDTAPLEGKRDGRDFTVKEDYGWRDESCLDATFEEKTTFSGTFTDSRGIKGTLVNQRVERSEGCEGQPDANVTCQVRWKLAGYLLNPGDDHHGAGWWGDIPPTVPQDTGTD